MSREEEKFDIKEVVKTRSEAAEALVKYLKTFRPEGPQSDSKHSLMGPVGKLLTRLTTTGDINWEAVKGYVLNVQKNQQAGAVPATAAEALDEAVRHLQHLRSLLPPTKWLRTVEDLDDEVFFRAYRDKVVGQRAFVQREFQEWLKGKFGTIERVNELAEVEQYGSFEEVPDPWSVPSGLQELVKEFWEQRKKKKEAKE
ncbi:MAG: hypothetical protein QXS20_08600 [Candidatus Thorarchaeota archaeon]